MMQFAMRGFTAVLIACVSLQSVSHAQTPAESLMTRVREAKSPVRGKDLGTTAGLEVSIRWNGDIASPTLRNISATPVAVGEVVLFDIEHDLAPETRFYGEGLQMLAQTAGTLALPEDVGEYPDRSHYRLPEPEGFRRVYGVCVLEPQGGVAPTSAVHGTVVAAFTSCHRFVGAFDVSPTRLRAIIDCEDLVLQPGDSWTLESFILQRGNSHGALLDSLAREIARAHPRTSYPAPPTGWCSWYCFGPRVTAKDVLDNLAAMKADFPELTFVQIDDGYQPTMGDWLDTGPGFGGQPVENILAEIRAQGREPAIWVAPFIASPDSRVLREHPDWFVQGDDRKPLSSDRVMFGGWRLGPWYVLDGTNPAVLAHFESLFRVMREKWGVRYFKLDAIFWGMMHGGLRHNAMRTRVEAYRDGMTAIRRGAGDDAYILGCNHPIWPSLGLIDGSRSSLDIERNWRSVSRTGRENLLRGWQNGALWWNDPDTIVQTGLAPSEARFHATLVAATGGAVLAGDDLSRLPRNKVPVIQALSKPTGVAAKFRDLSLSHGVIPLEQGHTRHAMFNWSDEPREFVLSFSSGKLPRIRDFWDGTTLEVVASPDESTVVIRIDPHDARLLDVHE
ncbi:MAG: alpha-galactosidase [Limnohabitans sp.]|nr:alpha-galactosidase [Limnohabitans sp.]